GRTKHPAETEATSADALDQRALRHQVNSHFARDHLLLRFGIEPNVTCYSLRDKACAHELANAAAWHRRVVGDNGEVTFALTHEFVDKTLRRTHCHESPDHEARSVGNHRNCIFDCDCLH